MTLEDKINILMQIILKKAIIQRKIIKIAE
jgi:hypothetical protein